MKRLMKPFVRIWEVSPIISLALGRDMMRESKLTKVVMFLAKTLHRCQENPGDIRMTGQKLRNEGGRVAGQGMFSAESGRDIQWQPGRLLPFRRSGNCR
jgi:hypothetical protein